MEIPIRHSLRKEDILHQVSIVVTKDGQKGLLGDLKNLPLLLHLLSVAVEIVGGLVSQKLPQPYVNVSHQPCSEQIPDAHQPVIPITPPGSVPSGRAGV
ncbi:MAG: hypothetical protein EHM49_07460 [Deltaproteobacteria bacterium]|nr:MAG: hypothetical protein EHM49_07460 [Deltaproteobacteria bacterium]